MNDQALRSQPPISSRIVQALRFLAMQMTVDFYGKLCCGAEEVEDVHAKWMLAAKDRSVGQASSQPRPQHDFGLGHRPTKALGPLKS